MRQLSNMEAGFVVPAITILFIVVFFGLLYAYERWQAGRHKNENSLVTGKHHNPDLPKDGKNG